MLDVSTIERDLIQQQQGQQQVEFDAHDKAPRVPTSASKSSKPIKEVTQSCESQRHAAQEQQPGHTQQQGPTWQQLELKRQAAEAVEASGAESHRPALVKLDGETAAFVRTLLPRNMAKYWLQRFSLFSRYEEGVLMDTEGW
jgi:capsule polysaccharide export protein KpsE/RkpR